MAEKVFAQGMIFKKPHERAPDFVKGDISIKVDEFTDFLKAHRKEDGWVNLQLLKSSKGTLYLALNTYEPKKKEDGFDFS